MKDYSNYSMGELEKMSKTAFSEYYKLATMPCTGQPKKSELDRLQKTVDSYEGIREEIGKRLMSTEALIHQ